MNLAESEEIFHRALEIASAEARSEFIASACRGEPALQAVVERLLAANERAREFLPDLPRGAEPEAGDGTRVGRYRLLEKIGEGGCGVVYVAEQKEPVRRRVALKVIKLGMDTKAVVARFEAERQALALMDHPNIAKVLDAGATEAGRPFFVMELVRGVRITEYCDENQLTTTQRLELFIKVCQAIQHAHQKGIIHRDIKPSNILVTLHDGVPVPKVIDFGIAKATEGRLSDATVYTQLRDFVGTPAYMSPEQSEMSGLDIDTRTDIYSLGVLLYELLTGLTPFNADELMAKGLEAMRQTIREQEPARPSTRLATLTQDVLTRTAMRRSVDRVRLVHQVEGDLDWIIMKCLEKDRTRRYETANGVAADLKRHLGNEPVVARPPSAIYRLQKAWRRNKFLYSAGLIVTVAILAGAFTSSFQANRARKAEALAKARLEEVERERDSTEQARMNAEQVSQFLQQIFESPDPSRDGRTITVAETLDRAAKQLETTLTNQPERRARLQSTLATTFGALGLPASALRLRERVQGFWREKAGLDDPESLRATRVLGHSLFEVGQLQPALKLTEDLLERTRRRYGDENTNTVDVLYDYANVLDLLGRHQEALKLREEVMAAYRRMLGPEHQSTLKAMNALGASYSQLSMKEAALTNGETVVALSRKVLGTEHPSTLTRISNLAVDYCAFKRYQEAASLLERNLETERRVFGPEHPLTIFTMQTLAVAYHGGGRCEEALKLRETVLEMTRRVLGPEDPIMVYRTRILAESYTWAGRTNEALKLLEEAVALGTKLFGLNNNQTIAAADNLSDTYLATGNPERALALRREVLEFMTKLFGEEHGHVAGAIERVAGVYAAQGKWIDTRNELQALLRFKTQPDSAHIGLVQLAALDLHLGEKSSYAALRDLILARFRDTKDSDIADHVAKACLLEPAAGDQLRAVVDLAERSVELCETNSARVYWKLLVSSLARYRSGDWVGARERSERSITLSKDAKTPSCTSAAYLVLAMACQRSGLTNDARNAFAQGEEIIRQQLPPLNGGRFDDSWPNVMIADILRREADNLMK